MSGDLVSDLYARSHELEEQLKEVNAKLSSLGLKTSSRKSHDGNNFVITDACKVENPILYASPSFLLLTGYSEAEVYGRGCAFLQGKDTDKKAIRRI